MKGGLKTKSTMTPKKRLNTKDLVKKIENLARERMTSGPVVELENLKSLRKKEKPSLLIIEDDETMRKSLSRLFESEGYRVITASDGVQLSEFLDDSVINIIVLDVGLPWINGFELAEMMKSHADLKSIPLIFISAHTDQEMIKKGFAVGADDYITKPFDIEKIKKTVKALLELS